jgi:hypothetical protein
MVLYILDSSGEDKSSGLNGTKNSNEPVGLFCRCGEVERHVLIFYAIIHYHYAEYTDELQLDDLQIAG